MPFRNSWGTGTSTQRGFTCVYQTKTLSGKLGKWSSSCQTWPSGKSRSVGDRHRVGTARGFDADRRRHYYFTHANGPAFAFPWCSRGAAARGLRSTYTHTHANRRTYRYANDYAHATSHAHGDPRRQRGRCWRRAHLCADDGWRPQVLGAELMGSTRARNDHRSAHARGRGGPAGERRQQCGSWSGRCSPQEDIGSVTQVAVRALSESRGLNKGPLFGWVSQS